MENEIVLLRISGEDKAGITAALSEILASYGASILDIGQSVIHNNLSLGILFKIEQSHRTAPVFKDLLFKADQYGFQARFMHINEPTYGEWVDEQGKDRHIVTLLARELHSEHLAAITKVLYEQQLNIDIINRLSGRRHLHETADTKGPACVELSVRGVPKDTTLLKSEFLEITRQTGMDIAFQQDNGYRRNRRLVCFDMDSTLIQAEVIVELAKVAGVGEKVHEITERAMKGELDFNESFVRRVALLKGIKEEALHDIARNLPITEGAERLIKTLKRYGYKIAILSGGFTYFGRYLQSLLGVDYVFANELEIVDGELTGRHVGEIVDGAMKAELVKKLAFKEDLDLEQVIAVGDGANDLPMLSIAGLGIAYHAKPLVRENAENAISSLGLDSLLYMLGLRDRDIDQ